MCELDLSDLAIGKLLDRAKVAKGTNEKMIQDDRDLPAHKLEIFGKINLENKTVTESRDRDVGEGNILLQKLSSYRERFRRFVRHLTVPMNLALGAQT